MANAPDLAALLCSRICHDLISPVGAVSNGVELLEGGVDPEIASLLNDSARTALAALGYFRVAFGAVTEDAAAISPSELGSIARAYFNAGRHRVVWPSGGEATPRAEAKLALLLAMAAVTASPIGGAIEMSLGGDTSARVNGSRLGMPPECAALLSDPAAVATAPREAHVALLAAHARSMGRSVAIVQDEGAIALIARRAG